MDTRAAINTRFANRARAVLTAAGESIPRAHCIAVELGRFINDGAVVQAWRDLRALPYRGVKAAALQVRRLRGAATVASAPEFIVWRAVMAAVRATRREHPELTLADVAAGLDDAALRVNAMRDKQDPETRDLEERVVHERRRAEALARMESDSAHVGAAHA